ncbi:DUF947-domain-containing protein [Ascobolus immersus RN42]|uniref:rRNA biogenesis protein RRP36 n=1 Tax=Ascobolus immersus RN42 TaxID=1160509 RepID=A0A3N4HSA3_ASCIM|nr:DUF947-domain-containing protein [Ascobolus immersus RN42]
MASKYGSLKRVNFQPDYSDDDIDLNDLSPNEFEEGDEDEDMEDGSEDEGSEEEGQSGSGSEGEGSEDEEGDYSDEGSEDDVDPTVQLASISFGTLAKAQNSILKSKSKKAGKSKPTADLSAIKESLAALKKKAKLDTESKSKSSRKALPEEHPGRPKRSDKNAPQVLTSKKPVTRKREVVPVPFIKPRDPRFDPALGTFNEAAFSKNYDFLEDYKESEAAAMRDRLKKIKDTEEKEKIKKELAIIDNQKKAKAKKEERESILREHKRKERELVKQGKKPYFLKKSDQERAILTQQYSKLTESQRESVMEKRRKRKAHKEKKRMPFARRVAS